MPQFDFSDCLENIKHFIIVMTIRNLVDKHDLAKTEDDQNVR